MSEHFGIPFRQIAHRLRIQRGSGNADKVSERPREGDRKRGWGPYLDSEEDPTLIMFDELDQVDVEGLLRLGAIEFTRSPQEVTNGEDR